MYISGCHHLFLRAGQGPVQLEKIIQSVPLPLAPAEVQYIALSILLLGFDKYKRMLYSNSCSRQQSDSWEMRKDRKMLVVESLVKRGRRKKQYILAIPKAQIWLLLLQL